MENNVRYPHDVERPRYQNDGNEPFQPRLWWTIKVFIRVYTDPILRLIKFLTTTTYTILDTDIFYGAGQVGRSLNYSQPLSSSDAR